MEKNMKNVDQSWLSVFGCSISPDFYGAKSTAGKNGTKKNEEKNSAMNGTFNENMIFELNQLSNLTNYNKCLLDVTLSSCNYCEVYVTKADYLQHMSIHHPNVLGSILKSCPSSEPCLNEFSKLYTKNKTCWNNEGLSCTTRLFKQESKNLFLPYDTTIFTRKTTRESSRVAQKNRLRNITNPSIHTKIIPKTDHSPVKLKKKKGAVRKKVLDYSHDSSDDRSTSSLQKDSSLKRKFKRRKVSDESEDSKKSKISLKNEKECLLEPALVESDGNSVTLNTDNKINEYANDDIYNKNDCNVSYNGILAENQEMFLPLLSTSDDSMQNADTIIRDNKQVFKREAVDKSMKVSTLNDEINIKLNKISTIKNEIGSELQTNKVNGDFNNVANISETKDENTKKNDSSTIILESNISNEIIIMNESQKEIDKKNIYDENSKNNFETCIVSSNQVDTFVNTVIKGKEPIFENKISNSVNSISSKQDVRTSKNLHHKNIDANYLNNPNNFEYLPEIQKNLICFKFCKDNLMLDFYYVFILNLRKFSMENIKSELYLIAEKRLRILYETRGLCKINVYEACYQSICTGLAIMLDFVSTLKMHTFKSNNLKIFVIYRNDGVLAFKNMKSLLLYITITQKIYELHVLLDYSKACKFDESIEEAKKNLTFIRHKMIKMNTYHSYINSSNKASGNLKVFSDEIRKLFFKYSLPDKNLLTNSENQSQSFEPHISASNTDESHHSAEIFHNELKTIYSNITQLNLGDGFHNDLGSGYSGVFSLMVNFLKDMPVTNSSESDKKTVLYINELIKFAYNLGDSESCINNNDDHMINSNIHQNVIQKDFAMYRNGIKIPNDCTAGYNTSMLNINAYKNGLNYSDKMFMEENNNSLGMKNNDSHSNKYSFTNNNTNINAKVFTEKNTQFSSSNFSQSKNNNNRCIDQAIRRNNLNGEYDFMVKQITKGLPLSNCNNNVNMPSQHAILPNNASKINRTIPSTILADQRTNLNHLNRNNNFLSTPKNLYVNNPSCVTYKPNPNVSANSDFNCRKTAPPSLDVRNGYQQPNFNAQMQVNQRNINCYNGLQTTQMKPVNLQAAYNSLNIPNLLQNGGALSNNSISKNLFNNSTSTQQHANILRNSTCIGVNGCSRIINNNHSNLMNTRTLTMNQSNSSNLNNQNYLTPVLAPSENNDYRNMLNATNNRLSNNNQSNFSNQNMPNNTLYNSSHLQRLQNSFRQDGISNNDIVSKNSLDKIKSVINSNSLNNLASNNSYNFTMQQNINGRTNQISNNSCQINTLNSNPQPSSNVVTQSGNSVYACNNNNQANFYQQNYRKDYREMN